jgi:CRP-like cAMP-binding protein
MNTLVELLQTTPLFGGIREEILDFLLGLSREVSAAPGEYFFHEDDEAHSMFVVLEGQAAVVKGWDGHSYVLMNLGRGDCFGEMSLMDMCRRSASVVAVGTCRAIELSSASLLKLYEKDLEQFALIQMNMGREVSRRLRDADERLFQAKMGVPGVLAAYVVRST